MGESAAIELGLYTFGDVTRDDTGARLSDAQTIRNVVDQAVLAGADLRGADLTGAVLTGTVLLDAELADADLSAVVWSDETRWPGTLAATMMSRSERIGPGTYRVRPAALKRVPA